MKNELYRNYKRGLEDIEKYRDNSSAVRRSRLEAQIPYTNFRDRKERLTRMLFIRGKILSVLINEYKGGEDFNVFLRIVEVKRARKKLRLNIIKEIKVEKGIINNR